MLITMSFGWAEVYSQPSEFFTVSLDKSLGSLSECNSFVDEDIERLLCTVGRKKPESTFLRMRKNTIIFYSELARDKNEKLVVISYDSLDMEFFCTESSLAGHAGMKESRIIERSSQVYLEFIRLFNDIQPGFYKQGVNDNNQKKRNQSMPRSQLLILRKKNDLYDAGVFCFGATKFKDSDAQYPSKVYDRLILWVTLNCRM